MAARSAIRAVLALVIYPGVLFGCAGTWRWVEGWIFLVLLFGFTAYLWRWLRRHDPALLRERMKGAFQEGQPTWDRVVMLLFTLLWIAWLVIPGLDAVRWRTSCVPLGLRVLGGLLHVGGWLVLVRAHQVNTFLSPVVRVQAERSQAVVEHGPYAIVRHPMYAGVIPWLAGASLLLGSWWALLPSVLIVLLLAVRTVLEEAHLRRHLDGYEAYARRVPYRLLPYVW